ncbi:MAG TPA: caspase family protein [Bacteroidales bacterium]|nr:caspase family protein [Bacteroidales bacterium]
MKLLNLPATLLLVSLFSGPLFSQSVETIVQTGHYAPVTAACYSPDGRFIATGSDDKTVKLWRRSDGKEIRTFQGNTSGISMVEINRQGTDILSVSDNGTITVWEISTGKLVNQIRQADDRFTCASFHPGGTKIIAGTRKSGISLWDIVDGTRISGITPVKKDLNYEKGFDYPEAKSIAYSTDGKYIIAGVQDYTAILFDATTGKEIRKYKNQNSECTSCAVNAVLSADNKLVIIGSSDSVKVFEAETGKFLKALYGQGGEAEMLCISANNRYLAAMEYGVAELWDLNTWTRVLRKGDYSNRKVMSVALSPDGKELVAGNEKRTADVIGTGKGEVIMTLKGYLNQVDERILTDSYMYWAALVNKARLSPDGRYIAVGRTGNNAKILDFKTGNVFRTLRGHKSMVISLAFSADSRYLATGGIDGRVIIWDVETGNAVRTFTFPDEKEAIFSLDFSNDGKMLAAAIWAGYVIIWDTSTGERIRAISPHDKRGCYQVKFTPNGLYFVSAGLDMKMKLIEIDTGEEVRTFIGHADETLINSVNFNAAGDRFITAGQDGSVRIWDIASGLQVKRLKAHTGGASSATFDPTGKFIITGGEDFMVKLWDANSGDLVCGFEGHKGGVGDVNVTSDLRYLISGSRDGSIKIWDVASKKEVVSVVFINDNDWFIRNPEGYFDATEGAYGSISFVRGTEIFNIGQFFNEFYRPGLYREAFGNNPAFRQNLMQTVEKYPPPKVEIVMPDAGEPTDNAFTTFMVKVTNNGGGVKEFKVMQNGKRQDVDYSDLTKMSKAGQYAMKTFDVNLVPGNNEITVSAFSEGDIESAPATIDLVYKGLQKSSDCWVLSIGINNYENESMTLTYARPDAQAVAETINRKASKLFNKIHVYTLLDRDATRAKILSTLDEISKQMKKEDVFVWFYAGHGSTVDNGFYFITSEVTGMYQQDKLKGALYVKDLQEKFRELPALKQVVFIDACHSGSSVETLAMRGGAEEKALAQLSRSSGIHVMASSESQQQSAEIKSLNHGVFTYVLLEALNGKADGAPLDQKVTVYEIKSYIDDQVPEISYKLIRHKQFPSTFSIGHDFPLVME